MSDAYPFETEDIPLQPNLSSIILSDIILEENAIENNNNNNNTAMNVMEEPAQESLLYRLLHSSDKTVKEQDELQQYDFYVELLESIQRIMDDSDASKRATLISQSFMERQDEPTPTQNDYGMMYLLQKNHSPKRTAPEWPWTDDQRVNTVKKMRVRYWKLRKGRGFDFQMRRYVFYWEGQDKKSEQQEPVIMVAHLVKDIRQNQAKKVIKKKSK